MKPNFFSGSAVPGCPAVKVPIAAGAASELNTNMLNGRKKKVVAFESFRSSGGRLRPRAANSASSPGLRSTWQARYGASIQFRKNSQWSTLLVANVSSLKPNVNETDRQTVEMVDLVDCLINRIASRPKKSRMYVRACLECMYSRNLRVANLRTSLKFLPTESSSHFP